MRDLAYAPAVSAPHADCPRHIGRCALRALHHELLCYPKPGLVSPVDGGSHSDMNAATFMRSLYSLQPYFAAIAAAGGDGAAFAVLQALGRGAETRMLQATGGVNTHRGAIFSLGLLAAAAGWAYRRHATRPALGDIVRARWGGDILTSARGAHVQGESHGLQMARQHRAGGARAEAAQGFPTVFSVGLPAWQEARRRGCNGVRAAVQTLFRLIAVVDDTNLLYRGGAAGLAFAQGCAQDFLARGGVYRRDWYAQAVAVHRAFVERRLSPGGSADLLGASLFVAFLQNDAHTVFPAAEMPPLLLNRRGR